MNIKKLFIASLLFLGISFIGADFASANGTYQIAQGSDGGQLYATVSNIKSVYSPGEAVNANMCLYNNSGALNSTSLAGGTNGTWNTYIPSSGCVNANVGTAPNSAGSYAVNYTVNYNRSASPQCSDGVDNDGDGLVDYPADPGCSSPSDNDEYNAPVATVVPFSINISGGGAGSNCGAGGQGAGYAGVTPCINASVSLSRSLSQSVSFSITHDYWDSVSNGPQNAHMNVTIPAGQTSNSGWTALSGMDYSYLTPDNHPNGTVVNVGGTQLSATGNLPSGTAAINGNTSLQLTSYSASYFFGCGGGVPLNGYNC